MSKKFSGVLATKRKPRHLGMLTIPEEQKKWLEEDADNLGRLCEHYGIKKGPDTFLELCLCLAEDFVPAFQEPKPRGRPEKWGWEQLKALAREMDALIKPNDPTHGITWAAKQLASGEPWRSFVEADDSKDPAEVIRRAYYYWKNEKEAHFSGVKKIFSK